MAGGFVGLYLRKYGGVEGTMAGLTGEAGAERQRPPGYISFVAGGRLFVCAHRRVLSIQRYSPPIPLASAPEFVLGLVPFAGRLIPAVDLALQVGLAPGCPSATSCFLIGDAGTSEVLETALVVEDVGQVFTSFPQAAAGEVASVPESSWGAPPVLVDMKELFSEQERRVLASVGRGRVRGERPAAGTGRRRGAD